MQKHLRQGTRDVQCREFLETLFRPVDSSAHSKLQSQPSLEGPPSIPKLGWLVSDFSKTADGFSCHTQFTYLLSYYLQVYFHNFGNKGVMGKFVSTCLGHGAPRSIVKHYFWVCL